MQALHRIPIHHAIASGDQCLSDFVPEDKLITWADNCRMAHDQLVKKVAAAADIIKSVRAGNEFETSTALDIDIKHLESLLTEVQGARQRLEVKHQRLERDMAKVEEILEGVRTSSSGSNEKFTALNHLHQIHLDDYLKSIFEADESIRATASMFVNSKMSLTRQVLRRLQSISQIQSQIAEVTPQLTDLSNLLNAHTQAFAQLLHVHRMPAAWGATLVEIVRRREFVRIFINKAQEMAEVLGRYRTQEEKRRETFRSEIVRYLPSDLVQGLDDQPPYCEVSLSNTRDSLPDLTRSDINEFEKLVMSIHSTMLDSEPGGAGASQTHSNHSISKLIATIVKMSSQIDGTTADFERVLMKTAFSERMMRLEEENSKLRMLAGRGEDSRIHMSRSPSMNANDVKGVQELTSLRNRVLEAEARCVALERKNQELENVSGLRQANDRQLQIEREKSTSLEMTLQVIQEENEAAKQTIASQQAELTKAQEFRSQLREEVEKVCGRLGLLAVRAEIHMLSKGEHFLQEIHDGLLECSAALHEGTKSREDAPRSPEQARSQTDLVRKALRTLQDDILCQTADLVSYREMLPEEESQTNTESITMEMVALAAEVAQLRSDLMTSEHETASLREQLTATEAHEAVVEADLASVRALLKRAEEDLLSVRRKLAEKDVELGAVREQHRVNALWEEKSAAQSKELETARSRMETLDLELSNARRETMQAHTSADAKGEQLTALQLSFVQLKETLRGVESAWEHSGRQLLDSEAALGTVKQDLAVKKKQLSDAEGRLREMQNRPSLATEEAMTLTDIVPSLLSQARTQAWVQLICLLVNQLRLALDSHVEMLRIMAPFETANEILSASSLPSDWPELETKTEETKMQGTVDERGAEPGIVRWMDDIGARLLPLLLRLPLLKIKEGILERWKSIVEREIPELKELYKKARRAEASKISFRNFKINDLALFLPTRNPKAWAAFNVNAPHYFLSLESSKVYAERMKNRDYFLAHITSIQDHAVNPKDPTTNPFGLATSSRFRSCVARPMELT
ncbi:oligomeric, coiled-coil, peripheral membrane protein [Thoreauomyces humboldtii]|nr:oligomeric, coiled-coil, peripheral membrane protein [Thoreauomyces humboldtii]